MLTIFTTPKPFIGHDNIIQTNAIKSWTLLKPECEIILMGNDEGTAKIAIELGLKHCPDIECNEYGTPLLSSVIASAKNIASNEVLCYINADIILLSDFSSAVQRVVTDVNSKKYLIVGQRWDIDIKNRIDYSDKNWGKNLKVKLNTSGSLHPNTGVDYFVFTKRLFDDIPPFAIGRTWWDNWLIYKARYMKADVIDATQAITAVHQNHNYAHVINGYSGAWKGPEALKNQELAGNGKQAFSLEYSTLKLTEKGIKHIISLRHLYFRLLALPILHPMLTSFERPLAVLTKTVSKIRSMLN